VAPIVNPPPPREDDEATEGSSDPYQRQILRDQLDRVAEEKRRALDDPGPSWHDWFYFDAAKWFVGLGFLIIDAWIIVTCLDAGVAIAVFPALVAALYLEFLGYQFLWYEPRPGGPRRRGPARRSWVRPVAQGRWTPEGVRAREHPSSAAPDQGPAPEEFL
jgi:hypothetical protein